MQSRTRPRVAFTWVNHTEIGMFTGTAGGPPVAERSSDGERAPSLLVKGRSLAAELLERRQRVPLVVAGVIAALALVPVAVLPAKSAIYAGIANPSPTIHTYTVAIVVAGAVVAIRATRGFLTGLLPWAPFLVWLVIFTIAAWDPSARTVSGLLQLGLGAVTFAIGAAAEAQDRTRSILVWAFAVAAWIQLVAILLATAGLPLRRIGGHQALDVLGRATGLTSHPGELAKLLFFCGLCALMLPQRTTWQRWAAWLTLGAVLAGVSLSQSRSVLVAIIAMIVIFVLLEFTAGRWQRRHFVVIGITLALGAASLPWLIARFSADPSGGARGHVAEVALRAIEARPWAGVGPNGYVAVVGATDQLTASGVPVHNAFLLSAAELGIAGAFYLWLPFLIVAVRAIYYTWQTRGADLAARVVVSALPGIGLIAMTGWGLMQGPYFLIFSLVMAYFGARAGSGSGQVGDGLH
jgi:O-antigen ligase